MKLAQHTFSSLFGTFLCNSLHDRRRHKVSQKSRSVWDYLEHHHVKFRNFLYESKVQAGPLDPIWPRCEVRDLLLWKDVYVVSDQKPLVGGSSSSMNTTNANGTSTSSSSGMNSRCEDALPLSSSSVDQVDSGANSSREDETNGEQSPPRSEMNQVHEELEKLSMLEASSAKPTTMVQRKLGPGQRAIESSTDTLVADFDERQKVINHEEIEERHTNNTEKAPQVPETNGPSEVAIVPMTAMTHKGVVSVMGGGWSPSNCLMGQDLSQYFKEPIDTDGLTAHHNQVQERLLRIFASHQAEVQALRRDLNSTRVALLRQRSSNPSSRAGDELLSVDIENSKQANLVMNSGSSSTGACSDASSTWEAVDEKEANPTLWIPDHAVAACMK